MKRFAASVLAGTAATAVALASASALGVPAGAGGGKGPGGWATATCDRDGLATALRTAFDPARGYAVTAVVVDGVDPRCGGHRLSVALTGVDGALAVEGGPVVVPAGGGRVRLAVPPLGVENVARVHVLVD